MMNRICKNCGLTWGAHLGGTYYSEQYNKYFCTGLCPGHEGRMDWVNGPGTSFKDSGEVREVNYNTPAMEAGDET